MKRRGGEVWRRGGEVWSRRGGGVWRRRKERRHQTQPWCRSSRAAGWPPPTSIPRSRISNIRRQDLFLLQDEYSRLAGAEMEGSREGGPGARPQVLVT